MSDLRKLMSVDVEGSMLSSILGDRRFADAAMGWCGAGLTVRVVRGRKMARFEGLMDEFAAALQFPYYFGENWPAFQECLEDMDWLTAGKGIVVAVTDAAAVLSEEPVADLATLVESFVRAAATYSQPIVDHEWWDRQSVPFHVVLQEETGNQEGLSAWREAGAELTPLTGEVRYRDLR